MANEIEAVDSSEVNEEVFELEAEEETQEDKPAEKPKRKFSDEEQLAIHLREAKKLQKRLGVDEAPKSEEKAVSKSSDLDWGQKAFLKTYGVQGSDELALVKSYMARTGDELDTVVSDDIFLGKLGKLREARAVAEATPKGTKRSVQPAGDDLSVALAKYKDTGELPKETDLRRKVLNKYIEAEKGSNFAPNSVIQGGSVITQ